MNEVIVAIVKVFFVVCLAFIAIGTVVLMVSIIKGVCEDVVNWVRWKL